MPRHGSTTLTLTELLDTLEDVGTQLSECASHVQLDTGQRLMITQAELRVAQVIKELRAFDDAG